jgi:hypothetical protein
VVDAAGNVISGAVGFAMTVTPKPGLTMGNPPVVNGLTATFPKLKKRLLNQDPTIDPNGDYADGDPTDPNYGKETGGLYTVELTPNGTAVKGTADLAVLPGGTAGLTLRILSFATDLGSALDAARTAASPDAVTAAQGMFAAIANNVDYTPLLLSGNNVLTPVNGFPVTYSQVAARFAPAPDDIPFTNLLDGLILQVQRIRTRLNSITPASLTQADVDALRAGIATYQSMVAQLEALKPGPAGITGSAIELNALLTQELPLLLDSVNRKSAELLAAQPAASFAPRMTASRIAMTSAEALPGDLFQQLYDQIKPMLEQFVNQYLIKNIVELAVSLVNDLVNIALKDMINDQATGDLTVDYVGAGSGFSFACPNVPNTYVDGEGLNPIASRNGVAVIGCINSEAVRSLVGLKPLKDLGSALKIFNAVRQIAQALGKDQLAANAIPDEVRDGLFGGSEIVFYPGWPAVNHARIPCVGLVVVFNFETGAFEAVNINMLKSCQ